MKRSVISICLLAGLMVASRPVLAESPVPPSAARAPGTHLGELYGVPFRIDLPERWNGGLVMFAHGYELPGMRADLKAEARTGSIATFLDRGFAVAQSAYGGQGWAVEEAVVDTEALRRHFVEGYGQPTLTLAVGGSMGGQITVALVERFPDEYTGGLALCGVLAPAIDFMTAELFDLLVTFEALFRGSDPAGVAFLDRPQVSVEEIAAALALKPAEAEAFARRFRKSTGELAPITAFYHVIYRELLQRAGGRPFDNTNRLYDGFPDDAALNRQVRRVRSDPAAERYLRRHYTPTGLLERPILSLQSVDDPVVPPEAVNVYDSIVATAGRRHLFVSRYTVSPGHCTQNHEQVGGAFDDLRRWIDSGVPPAAGLQP